MSDFVYPQNVNHAILNSFQIVCDKCQNVIHVESSFNVFEHRLPLRQYLQTSFAGIYVLHYYDANKTLSDACGAMLVDLIIGREIVMQMRAQN